MIRHTQKRPIATGKPLKRGGDDWRETTVRFDKETYNQIAAYARAEHTSFGEAVRTLVQFGLEDIGGLS